MDKEIPTRPCPWCGRSIIIEGPLRVHHEQPVCESFAMALRTRGGTVDGAAEWLVDDERGRAVKIAGHA